MSVSCNIVLSSVFLNSPFLVYLQIKYSGALFQKYQQQSTLLGEKSVIFAWDSVRS